MLFILSTIDHGLNFRVEAGTLQEAQKKMSLFFKYSNYREFLLGTKLQHKDIQVTVIEDKRQRMASPDIDWETIKGEEETQTLVNAWKHLILR